MSRHSSVKNKYTNMNNNFNSNTNTNNNIISTNPLSMSSTTFQRRGVRRRWENMRRSNQSVENLRSANTNNNNNNANNNGRNSIGVNSDLNFININNDNNNLGRNMPQINHESNGNNVNNNIIHNHNNYNIVNNFNNYDISGNSMGADSCFVQFRRIRRNYLDKQNFHTNNNINHNINENNNIPENNTNNTNNNIITNSNSISNNNNNINNNNINFSTNIENNNENHEENLESTDNINNYNENNNINTHENTNDINNNNEISINSDNNTNNNAQQKEDEIKDSPKKEQEQAEESKEETIGSEIKDAVKCYICFEKIIKPKMCLHCHRMACEKCLYNWFINLKKDKCGFCRVNTNFNQMISVPFMDVVVNFVENFFNKNKNYINNIDKELEYCTEHENELLYYYCLDCGKAYCKTCFVFFGEEKDKHTEHSIIEYEKYKNMSFPLLKKNLDKLESNIQHVEENIKRCISYKNSYEHQRKVGNEFINNLQDAFNNQMDVIISSIDNHIKKLNDYINEYNKYKKDIDEFYYMIKHKNTNTHQDKSCESLIIKLTNINQHKFFSSKEIEKLSDLSKNFYVNTYQSKIGEFNHENIFLSRGLKMGNGPCELVIDNKQRDEVLISLNIPKNKFHGIHNFKGIIFIRKKGECLQSYDLDEYIEDYNFYYLKKKIPWDFIGSSIFKLKGILYDFYFS